MTAALGLDPEAYAAWVDWTDPLTGESMGRPRLPGEGRQGSPRFAEMVVNAPKSLSIAAALHPEVSGALDRAQQDAVGEIQRWLAQHSVTRVGPRGKQEVVPVQQLQTVAVSHRTSRAGDPHRHIHFQIGTRVWAAGKWRALDTAALFRQQRTIRALGTAVIAAHPELAEVLDRYGLTLDPVSGEAVELERFNGVMSKRGEQVRKHLERFEAEWDYWQQEWVICTDRIHHLETTLAGMTAPSKDDPEKPSAHPKTIAAYQERLETARARARVIQERGVQLDPAGRVFNAADYIDNYADTHQPGTTRARSTRS